MAELREFSRILIFKDTPYSRFNFGEPLVNPTNLVATSDLSNENINPYYKRLKAPIGNQTFHGSNPPFDYNTWENILMQTSYLNNMGVDETTGNYNLTPTSSGTGIIVDDIFFVGGSGLVYEETTTFAPPSPALTVGDYIFWGDDPNNLYIGGKIKVVYSPGSPEYLDGMRYQFEKDTNKAFPLHTSGTYEDSPIPQQIYYYRKTWNGKGISNDIMNGFYVLIGIEKDDVTQKPVYYPYLDTLSSGLTSSSPDDRVVDITTADRFAYTDLIRIRRISNRFESDKTGFQTGLETEEIIPCTIHRTNGFWYQNSNLNSQGQLTSLFTNADQAPNWCAYYVNPYGNKSNKLDKNTTYVLEINERLPTIKLVPTGANDTNFFYWAVRGLM